MTAPRDERGGPMTAPRNELEANVIGSALLLAERDPQALAEMIDAVKPGDFILETLGRAWASIVKRHEQGFAIDAASIADGDQALMSKLTIAIAQVPAFPSGPKYARELAEVAQNKRFRAALREADELVAVGDTEATAALLTPYLTKQKAGGPRLVATPLSEVKAEATAWAWADRLPLGELTLLIGAEGQGKSTLAVELCARITRGQLDGDLKGTPRAAIYVTSEDHANRILRPRLEAAGADLGLVVTFGIKGDQLALTRHLGELADHVARLEAAVIVLDPLVSALSEVDTWKSGPVREVLEGFGDLLASQNCAGLGVLHTNRSETKVTLDRASESKAFTRIARAALGFGLDPGDERKRVVALIKSNLGPLGIPVLSVGIEEREVTTEKSEIIKTSGLVWLGEAEGVSARSVFAAPLGEDEAPGEDEVCSLLREVLSEGDKTRDQLRAEVRSAGLAASDKKLQRALSKIGAKHRRPGYGAPFVFSLWGVQSGQSVSTVSTLSTMSTLSTLVRPAEIAPEIGSDPQPGQPGQPGQRVSTMGENADLSNTADRAPTTAPIVEDAGSIVVTSPKGLTRMPECQNGVSRGNGTQNGPDSPLWHSGTDTRAELPVCAEQPDEDDPFADDHLPLTADEIRENGEAVYPNATEPEKKRPRPQLPADAGPGDRALWDEIRVWLEREDSPTHAGVLAQFRDSGEGNVRRVLFRAGVRFKGRYAVVDWEREVSERA